MPFSAPARHAGLLAALLLATVTGRAAAVELTPAPGGAIDLRDGAVTVAHLQPQTPALRRGTAAIREQTVDGHRVAVVRIPVRGSARVEEWLIDLGAKPAKVLWSGMTGPRDSDDEVAVHVDVTTDEIVEYQTAAQVSRCDGAPARLFPRAWDFDTGRFRPVLSPLPAAAAATLVARRDDPQAPLGRPAGGFRWVAASTTAAEGHDARGLTAPTALDDGNPATAWARRISDRARGGWPGADHRAAFHSRRRAERRRLPTAQSGAPVPAGPGAGNRSAVHRRDPGRSRHRQRLGAAVLGGAAEAGALGVRDHRAGRRLPRQRGGAAKVIRHDGHRRHRHLHRPRSAGRTAAPGRGDGGGRRLRRTRPLAGQPGRTGGGPHHRRAAEGDAAGPRLLDRRPGQAVAHAEERRRGRSVPGPSRRRSPYWRNVWSATANRPTSGPGPRGSWVPSILRRRRRRCWPTSDAGPTTCVRRWCVRWARRRR